MTEVAKWHVYEAVIDPQSSTPPVTKTGFGS